MFQFEGVAVATEHSVEITIFAYPEVLVTRLARDIFVAGVSEHIVNKPGAIHSPAIWVRGTIGVGQIPLGQSKRRPDEFLDFWGLAIVFAQIARLQTCHRRWVLFCHFLFRLVVAALAVRRLFFVTLFGKGLKSRGRFSFFVRFLWRGR